MAVDTEQSEETSPAEHVRALEHQLWCMEQDATAQADFRRYTNVVAEAVLSHLQQERGG